MNQATARKLAVKLHEQRPTSIYLAVTVDHLEGRFDGADVQWVVINIASPWERITEVPEGVDL